MDGITGIAGANTTYLVEDGPQYVTHRIPDSVGRMKDGTPRMGYQSLPADYAFQEYVLARTAKATGSGITLLGLEVDIYG